jgi:hypothetical protein
VSLGLDLFAGKRWGSKMQNEHAIKLLNHAMEDLGFYRVECQVVAATSGYEVAFKLLTDKLKEMELGIEAALDASGDNATTNKVKAFMLKEGL